MKHPIQNTAIDKDGVLRFVKNDVVNLMVELLEKRGFDLNAIHASGRNICPEDWDQFNQLIGYSVSGAPIDSTIVWAAQLAHDEGKSIELKRAENAEATILSIRKSLRVGISELYEKHPDDLMEVEDGE